MKRMKYIMSIAIIILNLAACQRNLPQDKNETVLKELKDISIATAETKSNADIAIELYKEFLAGNTTAEGWNIDEITIPTGEPNKRYATSYAYFDSNGDDIPELHIKAGRYYNIFTIKNNEIVEWKTLSPNPPFYALNNGSFICRRLGAGPMEDIYNYIILDYSGNEVYSLGFSKYDKNQNGIYDEADEYLFDGVNVSKDQWDLLTQRFLYIDEAGIEQIKDEIEWTILFEGTD